MFKQDQIAQRALDEARYIIGNPTTVREVAKKFGVSKSTVHKDLTERLPEVWGILIPGVRKILDTNKSERHRRGGEATRVKYSKK